MHWIVRLVQKRMEHRTGLHAIDLIFSPQAVYYIAVVCTLSLSYQTVSALLWILLFSTQFWVVNIDKVKRFVLTLNFYSPKAYEYVRSVFKTLPHPSSMANWTSTINCEPGFFEHVFREIKSKTENKKHERDVTLVCDAMGICSDVTYNMLTDHSTDLLILVMA